MARLPILTIPDPRLRQIASPVTVFDAALRQQLDDMLETMYAAPGIGLAATQVGIMRRFFVMDCEASGEERKPRRIVNPEILRLSEEESGYDEACLSLPGINAVITRPSSLTLRYQDEYGVVQELEAEGLLATCIQHELDHLNGKLFFDYLSPLRRKMLENKCLKYLRHKAL